MVKRTYVPDAGDVVWLDFDPGAGREQAGRRPAVVLTPRTYNQAANLAIMCPVTRQAKGYPFEVALAPSGSGLDGVILVDHLKSVDWQARHAEYEGKAESDVMVTVRERLRVLLVL